jgi:hypothetical protein
MVQGVLAVALLPTFLFAADPFIRGDVNGDGSVGIPDLVLLRRVLAGVPGASPGCPDAADIDDNGELNAADGEAFVARFFATPEPVIPAPFPVLGFDPTPDALEPAAAVDPGLVPGGAAWNPQGRLLVPAALGARKGGDAAVADLFPPGGGSDLQYIHFACARVVLEPGASLRMPITLRTKRPLGGASFAVAYDEGLLASMALDFSGSAPAQAGGLVWQMGGPSGSGRLAATCLFEHDPPTDGWSFLTIGHAQIRVAPAASPGTTSLIAFAELPLPGSDGIPWICNEVSDDRGYAYDLLTRSRPVEIVVSADPAFVRGETDRNGRLDMGDAVHLLQHLFSAGVTVACPDAADVNDDGTLALSDVVALLGYLWTGTTMPAAPFPDAAPDPTPDDLPPCQAQPLGLLVPPE